MQLMRSDELSDNSCSFCLPVPKGSNQTSIIAPYDWKKVVFSLREKTQVFECDILQVCTKAAWLKVDSLKSEFLSKKWCLAISRQLLTISIKEENFFSLGYDYFELFNLISLKETFITNLNHLWEITFILRLFYFAKVFILLLFPFMGKVYFIQVKCFTSLAAYDQEFDIAHL